MEDMIIALIGIVMCILYISFMVAIVYTIESVKNKILQGFLIVFYLIVGITPGLAMSISNSMVLM